MIRLYAARNSRRWCARLPHPVVCAVISANAPTTRRIAERLMGLAPRPYGGPTSPRAA